MNINHITIAGKEYPVKFTFSVLAALERETDHKNILNEIQDWGVNDAIVMAYLGCKKADPNFNMTVEEVGDGFTGESLDQVFKAFTSQMAEALGVTEKK